MHCWGLETRFQKSEKRINDESGEHCQFYRSNWEDEELSQLMHRPCF